MASATAAMTATEAADTEAIDRAPLLHVLVESPVISSTSALPAHRQACQMATREHCCSACPRSKADPKNALRKIGRAVTCACCKWLRQMVRRNVAEHIPVGPLGKKPPTARAWVDGLNWTMSSTCTDINYSARGRHQPACCKAQVRTSCTCH